MGRWLNRAGWWRLAIAASGTAFFLDGCDPTLRTTVEDGIINVSTSFLAALLRAAIEVGQEETTTETAQVLMDAAQRVLA